jgi:hypothetical protein
MTTLTLQTANHFASLALSHVTREYPNKLEHVLNGPDDLQNPRALHPVFYGSYDWHSCVHGYWLLARLLRRQPDLEHAGAIHALFDSHLTPTNVAHEVDYLRPASRATFERPYGWAWALMLQAELAQHGGNTGAKWSTALQPLADAIELRWMDFLPKCTYPIRVGTHFNTAFAITLSLAYADSQHRTELADALRHAAIRWYAADRNCQAWEPSGDEFLSSALMEAECMRRVLPAPTFIEWFRDFLPGLGHGEPPTLLSPAKVSDRSDGKIAHLDGVNLSRSWCWRHLASTLSATDSRRAIADAAYARHLHASLQHIAGDYAGEHWLATFALLAIDE